MNIFTVARLLLLASQLYWARRGYRFLSKRGRAAHRSLARLWMAVLAALYRYNLGSWRKEATSTRMTLRT